MPETPMPATVPVQMRTKSRRLSFIGYPFLKWRREDDAQGKDAPLRGCAAQPASGRKQTRRGERCRMHRRPTCTQTNAGESEADHISYTPLRPRADQRKPGSLRASSRCTASPARTNVTNTAPYVVPTMPPACAHGRPRLSLVWRAAPAKRALSGYRQEAPKQ